MRKEEYRIMYEMEDAYWWYVGLRAIFFEFLEKYSLENRNLRILDTGCGTGGTLKRLTEYGKTYGIDVSSTALNFCKRRKISNLIQASANNIPFKDNSFDVVISNDVLNLSQIRDDLSVLKKYHRILKENGIVILNVPAYNFLMSEHDRAVDTKHRYTKKEISSKLKKAGFIPERITYWNTVLFPVLGAARLLKKLKSKNLQPRSDLKRFPAIFNNPLTSIIMLEARLLKRLNLPFGLSLFALARKGDRETKELKIGRIPREIGNLYSKLGQGISLYAKLRWRLCPYEKIERYVPQKGKIIDIGCGYGLFSNLLALKSPKREAIGIDWSEKRIRAAKRTINTQNLKFYRKNINEMRLNNCDSIVMLDVLHHLPSKVQRNLLLKIFSGLKEGGSLIIQDVDKKPFWKYLIVKSIDTLVNLGRPICYCFPQQLCGLLRQIGFKVKVVKIDKGLPLPDVLFVCNKEK